MQAVHHFCWSNAPGLGDATVRQGNLFMHADCNLESQKAQRSSCAMLKDFCIDLLRSHHLCDHKHKILTCTPDRELGARAQAEVVAELRYDLPATMKFHKCVLES
jgi:hypothetical protein